MRGLSYTDVLLEPRLIVCVMAIIVVVVPAVAGLLRGSICREYLHRGRQLRSRPGSDSLRAGQVDD